LGLDRVNTRSALKYKQTRREKEPDGREMAGVCGVRRVVIHSAGVFDFTALQQLLDLANQTGLRVLVQMYSFYSLYWTASFLSLSLSNSIVQQSSYADSAPDWVASTYPEAEFVTETSLHIHSQSVRSNPLSNCGRTDI
jgi:hypothetical protein